MKKNSTKRALIMSAIAIMLCLVMLAGTTFAWFSDTASNKQNRIQAGTLDIQLLKYNEDEEAYVDISNGTGDILNEVDWEPGLTKTVYLAVRNNGSLDAKYYIQLAVTDAGLKDVISVAIVDMDDPSPANAYSPQADEYLALNELPSYNDENGVITAAGSGVLDEGNGETQYFALSVHMLETAGNTYQGLGFGFDATVIATQINPDAVNDADDNDRAYVIPVADAADFAAAVQSVNNHTIPTGVESNAPAIHQTIALTKNVNLDGEAEFTDYCNIDFNGYTLTGNVTFNIAETRGYGTVDIGEAADTVGTITGTVTITAPRGTFNVYGNITVAEGADAVKVNAIHSDTLNLYCKIVGNINLSQIIVSSAAPAHIVIAPVAQIAGTIKLPEAPTETLKLEISPIADTSEAMVQNPNQSEPTPLKDSLDVKVSDDVVLSTPADLLLFEKKVNAGEKIFAGKTIKFGGNIDLTGINWNPINARRGALANSVIDGCGYTISNFFTTKYLSKNSSTTYGCGFIGDIDGKITIKNLTFDNAYACMNETDSYKGNIIGIVMGYSYGTTIFENVKVVNSKVTGFGKVGLLLGMGAEPGMSVTYKNCVAENNTIKGLYNLGALAGNIQRGSSPDKTVVSNCTVKNNTFEVRPGDTYVNFTNVATNEGLVANGHYWQYGSGDAITYYAGYANLYVSYGYGDDTPIVTEPYVGTYLSARELCVD